MTFESRITRQPLAHDPGAASETAVAFADLGPGLSGLLAATAGCSPFLRDLMIREADWLRPALQMSPEPCFARLLAACDGLAPDLLSPVLRQAKRRVALLVALADLGGVWTLEEATCALTAFADRAVQTSLSALVAEEIRRGKLPGATPDDAATAAGMVVLAMGKMGAQELNYSSDIDLICLFDETRHPGTAPEARSAFIRVTRRLAAVLSDSTQDGYVFRTDLRLRPDAAVTPVCLSMAAAESYYEAQGRTWERAAYIKARPCAGDLAAGERFLRGLIPFVWRRHLDFAAIQDAHDMRLRIRDHRNLHGPVQIEGHNLKLGQGGIREIEFFTQTRQLIAGGRDPALRGRTTTGALAALAEKGWLPPDVAEELTQHYRAHRELEHRLQMVHDAQTHVMPSTAEGMVRIAQFCGEADVDAFRSRLKQRLERVETLTGGFFAPAEAPPRGPDLSPQASALVDGWFSYPALRSERAAAIFQRLRPLLLNSLSRAANPDEALVALDGFLAGLPAGVQLFSLFEANPPLVDLIVDIASTAPALARYLARNASVLDAVIGGSFFAPWPGEAALAADLTRRLDAEPDYEKKLDTARRWMKEWHFRVGVHHLRGLIDAAEAGTSYADLAAATLQGLWPALCQQVARRYGNMPGRGAVVLGMGSLGAGRLNAASDLDLIMVYDAPADAVSTGPRPLGARAWYARLTQALVTALTAPMAGGKLYEVDMRLRPSGRQGPVATSFEAFCHYHRDEAWTWEHLALTRARVVVGGTGLGEAVEQFRRSLILEKGQGARVLPDAAAMRVRLLAAWPAPSDRDAKTGAGRLMDIEFLAQTAALLAGDPQRGTDQQLRTGRESGLLSAVEAETLLGAWRLFWTLRVAGRLLTDCDLKPGGLGQGGCAFLLRETGAETAADLTFRLRAASEAAAAVIGAKLVGVQGDGETGDADDRG
jgi:glutamate-ammonia-ligase adenylyltransferase